MPVFAGCCGWVVSACRRCVPICRLPGVGWAWGGAGPCRCGRISSALCRYAFTCRFLRLRLSGIPDLRAYLWVAVRGGLCRCCGSRRLDAYLAGAVEMGAYSRVAVAGWCRLAIDAFPSAGCRARGGRGVPREPADAGVSCQCCRKSVPIRGFLLVCVCGVSDLCAYLAVAGRGMVRGWCGNRDVRAYLIHAAQIRVRLRVPAAVPVRLLGFACLSCGC
ncbi:hypothetical protein BPORC_1877 [Bifidobacterium porcinum]|nr:hypothetical protein BPORC_1877 [Bifidobacterium porcinum]